MKSIRSIVLPALIVLLMSADVLCATSAPKGSVSRFSAKSLRSAVERFLRARLESTDTFSVGENVMDQVFEEPGITARCDASAESLRGTTRIPIVFLRGDEPVRRVYVPARITRMRKVPVLTRSIRKGDVLQESDVLEQLVDVTYLNGESATSYVGKRSNFALGKGSVITSDHLVSASGIQRGDVVTLNVVSGSVVIRTVGIALDDATTGQAVRVRRQDSSVVLTGTAAENKTVTLSLAQS